MAAIEKMNNLKPGQTLLVDTHEELLLGTLQKVDLKNMIIQLDNVRDTKTNFVYQIPQILMYQQMHSIKVIENEPKGDNMQLHRQLDLIQLESSSSPTVDSITTSPMSSKSSIHSKTSSISLSSSSISGEHLSPASSTVNNITVDLTNFDFEKIEAQLKSLHFITQTDNKYHSALNDMRNQSVIGLTIEPVNATRRQKISLLAVATSGNIYIFDLLCLGKIFKEFRIILEAEWPKKAIHYSHRICDHLKFRHNIKLNGIFDTFMAYCLVRGDKSPNTLEETIKQIYNIPPTYFEPRAENRAAGSFKFNINNRPLPEDYRIIIAKKVAFQLKLHQHLLHEQMLKKFYSQCQQFSETFFNNPDTFEVAQEQHPSSDSGFEHIQPKSNWKEILDKDLDC